jgi:hypothetical protein
MKNTLAIAVTQDGQNTQLTQAAEFLITLNPEAERLRASLLEAAARHTSEITCIESQLAVTNAAAMLKGFAKDIEKSRVEIKNPFLEAGRAIDASAKAAVTTVNAAIARLEGLLGDYQRKETAKAEAIAAEQRRIAAEIERKRREAEETARRETERLAREAEEARQRTETARLAAERAAAEATTKKAREAAEKARLEAEAKKAESDRLASEQLERELDASFQEPAAPVLPPSAIAAPPKVEGGRVNNRWEIEVLPGGLEALYAWAGTRFVKLELDKTSLQDYLNWPSTDPAQIPGIRATREIKVSVRAK